MVSPELKLGGRKPPVTLTFGPILLGVFANMILYGVLIVQAFIYYRTYKHDVSWMRYFVLYLFIAETVNTGLDIAMIYEPLILRYASPHATTYFPLMFPSEPIMIVAVSTPIQIFLAWRIRLITKRNWIPIIIIFLAITSFAGGIWTAVKIANLKLYAKKPQLHPPALLWFGASCIVDILITAVLVRSLSQRKTGFRDTDNAIDHIIRLTVQTGLFTAIAAVGDVIFFVLLPHTALNFLWDFALSKMYTNSLLSTLNGRVGWGNLSNQRTTTNNLLFSERTARQTTMTNNATILGPMLELEDQKSRPFRDTDIIHKARIGGCGVQVTRVVEQIGDPAASWDNRMVGLAA